MTLTRLVLWILAVAYWAVLATLTHLPPQRALNGPGGDKLHHVLAYFLLAALLGPALWYALPARRRFVPLIVLVVAAAYGAVDELTQPFIGRFCEFGDWVADVTGAAVACGLLYLVQAFSSRRADAADAPESAGAVESA